MGRQDGRVGRPESHGPPRRPRPAGTCGGEVQGSQFSVFRSSSSVYPRSSGPGAPTDCTPTPTSGRPVPPQRHPGEVEADRGRDRDATPGLPPGPTRPCRRVPRRPTPRHAPTYYSPDRRGYLRRVGGSTDCG